MDVLSSAECTSFFFSRVYVPIQLHLLFDIFNYFVFILSVYRNSLVKYIENVFDLLGVRIKY